VIDLLLVAVDLGLHPGLEVLPAGEELEDGVDRREVQAPQGGDAEGASRGYEQPAPVRQRRLECPEEVAVAHAADRGRHAVIAQTGRAGQAGFPYTLPEWTPTN